MKKMFTIISFHIKTKQNLPKTKQRETWYVANEVLTIQQDVLSALNTWPSIVDTNYYNV